MMNIYEAIFLITLICLWFVGMIIETITIRETLVDILKNLENRDKREREQRQTEERERLNRKEG